MALWKSAIPVVCAAMLVSAACSRSRTVETPGGKVTVEDKGAGAGSVTVTGTHGEKVTTDVGAAKVPDDYPKDVPVYSGAKVNLSQTISEKNARNLMLETGDSTDAVASFYKTSLQTNGWTTRGTVAMGGMHLITATKAGKELSVQITDNNGKRNIMQTLADKQ